MRALVPLAMFCIASAPLLAQAPAELAEGTRLRVRSVSSSGRLNRGIEGTLERRAADTLWVRPTEGGELTAYTPSARQELFVYSGRASSAGRGALLGGGFGALAGAAIGFAAGRDCGADEWLCFDRGTTALLGGVGLGLTGLVGGLIIGALSSHEVWRPASPTRVTPIVLGSPSGVTFGLALRF
jgi:hypothetical protein